MQIPKRSIAMYLAICCSGAQAETATQKPLDEINGCIERVEMEKHIADYNFAELLRGAGTEGKTYAIWTNGNKIMILNYMRPTGDKMNELKIICVTSVVSNVNFNFNVIEKLVHAATESLNSK